MSAIMLLVLVGIAALVIKWFTQDEDAAKPEPGTTPVDDVLAEVQDLEPGEVADIVAVDSEGMAFVPDGVRVLLIPPAESGGITPNRQHTHEIDRGDLIAVRVVRGAPDFDPWRLEALGRDYEYRAWFFETEEAANAARDTLDRKVVVPPRDEYEEPKPPTASDFEDARRRDEETEHALDSPE
jgi:hypothetical protein